jgi:hypothetical protein
MNRLMVKPMPQSSATPTSCDQLAPIGTSAKPARMASAAAPNTPTSLPTSSPSATPSVRGASSGVRGHAGEGHAGVGEAEQGDDAERHPAVQAVLQPVQGRARHVVRPAGREAEGDGQGERDPGDGGVDARAQHEEPKQRADSM